MNLSQKVIDEIHSLGVKEAKNFFGVSAGTISNWASGKTSPSIAAVELVLSKNDEWDDIVPDSSQQPEKEILCDWEGKDVIILQPVYRTFNPDTHFTLFANYAKYGPSKIGLMQEKRTVIHESRNILSNRYLNKTPAKAAIMVDDDMVMPCGNVELFNGRYGANVDPVIAGRNAISRIMSHPPEMGIVGALYYGRLDDGKPQCSKGFTSTNGNREIREARGEVIPDEWVGTGFIRIQRWVFEKMKAEIDNGRWPECKPQAEDSWYGFFNPLRVRVGEDVSFGRRAKEIGIQSYVDTGLVCLHAGDRYFGPSNTRIT